MNKLKLFLENFLVYGLGGIISKIIPLIMVPIIIRIIPSSEYFGIFDLQNTVTSFACSLAVFGMYDAMYRMFFEKDDEEYKESICSTTLVFTLIISFVVSLLLVIFRNVISIYFFSDVKYSYLVYYCALSTFLGATNGIISAPTRMQNKRTVFLIMNTVGPILSYIISIPLLLKGYYVIALPLATVINGVITEVIFYILNKKWFLLSLVDFKLLKQLLPIAVPLLPNFIIYWLFNSCDKVMITNMLDIGEAGIYSVGSKLGHASQLIYTAFSGGWQYFAFSTMKEENQVKSNSKIFEYLCVISFVCTMIVCLLSKGIYKILFTEEYLRGYIISPYLFLAPLLQMLFQVAANQFLVVKKTWPNLFILGIGAIVNIILNYFLIPVLGIEGAAIATLLGYVVSDIICVVVLVRMKLMEISFSMCFSWILMLIFFVLWRVVFINNLMLSILTTVFVIVILTLLYMKDIILLANKKG